MIPAGVGATLNSDLDWQYLTEYDGRSCLGMVRGACLWHAGRVLGGGSTINGMMYVRGDQEDFDTWSARGNAGWSWREVLHYFKKSEKQNNLRYAADTVNHGTSGPWSVSDLRFPDSALRRIYRSRSRGGIPSERSEHRQRHRVHGDADQHAGRQEDELCQDVHQTSPLQTQPDCPHKLFSD